MSPIALHFQEGFGKSVVLSRVITYGIHKNKSWWDVFLENNRADGYDNDIVEPALGFD